MPDEEKFYYVAIGSTSSVEVVKDTVDIILKTEEIVKGFLELKKRKIDQYNKIKIYAN